MQAARRRGSRERTLAGIVRDVRRMTFLQAFLVAALRGTGHAKHARSHRGFMTGFREQVIYLWVVATKFLTRGYTALSITCLSLPSGGRGGLAVANRR
jgi:hypothetical protein